MNSKFLHTQFMHSITLTALMTLMTLTGCLVDDSSESSENNSPSSTNNSSSATTATSDVQYRRTLSAAVNQVAVPTYQALNQRAADQTTAIASYCAALDTPNESTALATAQSAWSDLNSTWQQVEPIAFGPIAENGATLRRRIYSWPDAVNSCTADQYVIRHEQEGSTTVSQLPLQAKGIDSLEYLLFSNDLNHTCVLNVEITDGWNDLPDAERKAQRCRYAEHIATGLEINTQQLEAAWVTNEPTYGTELIERDDQTAALTELSDQLFALDIEVKDLKLGTFINTPSSTSEEEVESPYSHAGLDNLYQNLLGYRSLFVADLIGADEQPNPVLTEQNGFDFILAAKNFPELATAILNDFANAIDVARQLSEQQQAQGSTLRDLALALQQSDTQNRCLNVSSNPSDFTFAAGNTAEETTIERALQLCQLSGYVKRVTDQLKGDFLTVVSLSLPIRVESDND